MNERYASTDKLIVVGLWILELVIVKATIAGVVWFGLAAEWVRLVMLALIPLTALTSVLHVRLYAVRMCSMIRATAGIHPDRDAEVRRLHP